MNNNNNTSEEKEECIMNDINIFAAVKTNNINKVKEYINNNGDVHIKDVRGWSLLHWVALNGHHTVVEYLIANGADVNIKDDEFGWSPLHLAANKGHHTMVEYLIANGTDINIKNRGCQTPLHEAAERGHHNIVEYLIANGANVNNKTNYGWSPLHYAADKGHHTIVEYLIANGADVNIKTDYGRSPLEWAADATYTSSIPNYINTVKILLPLTNLTNIDDIYKLYKCKLNTRIEGYKGVINKLIINTNELSGREYERYFTFCELFSIGTNSVEDDNNKQEKNSLMIGYDAPLDINEEEEARPFPPMFDSNLDASVFDATLVGEIWDYARDFLSEEEINNYIEEDN